MSAVLLALLSFAQASAAPRDQLERAAAGADFDGAPQRAAVAAVEGSLAKPGGALAASAPAPVETMADKARIFEDRTRLEHRPWFGLVLIRRFNADGSFKLYDSYGDSAIWTGSYVASQAFRYEATKDPEALKNMEESLWGLHALHDITGIPGLISRTAFPMEYALEHQQWPHGKRHAGTGQYEGWVWEDDLSHDQYDGWLFGVANAWPHIRDPKLKEALRQDLLAIGRHVIKNDLRIVGPMTFLDFRANYFYQDRWPKWLRRFPMPHWRAGNSMHGLHLMLVCAELTGDPELRKYYEEKMLLEQEFDLKMKDSPSLRNAIEKNKKAIEAVARARSGEKLEARWEWMRSTISANLSHMALYDLSRLETDPGLRRLYRDELKKTHGEVAEEGNSWWNLLYASQFPEDRREVGDAVESLKRFPTRPILGRVKNSEDPAIPKHKGLHGDTGFPPQWFTDRPLPFERRAFDGAFPWQHNPYKLDGGPEDEQGSGAAYLSAYWLGRKLGVISPAD